MKRALRGGAALSSVFAIAACATPPATDFGGDWRPVNRFRETPTEIPLSPTYTYYATPIDATLKAMLERWASDTGLKLSYQLGSDFTLFTPVAGIRTTEIQTAAAELSAVYASQGVSVTADSKQIVVQPASDTRSDPQPEASTSARPAVHPTNDRGAACQGGAC